MRGAAVAQARGRSVPARGRTAAVLAWLTERGVALPDLARVGAQLVVQRAARRLLGAANGFVRGVPGRYRQFRRQRAIKGRWYLPDAAVARGVSPLEVDLVLLSLLRAAATVSNDSLLMRRLGERAPAILADVARLQRNQILVDEGTDFSPVQLACMRALANPWTESFLVCGDFNQRLTRWGARTGEELNWVAPGIELKRVRVGYRQSRQLNALAALLAAADDENVTAGDPEQVVHDGVSPVLGTELGDTDALVAWLATRIGEIEATLRQLPTVAILVNDAPAMREVAAALNEVLAPRSLRAVACPDGQVIGQSNDVRVFEVEHIKGLEFEAVLFVDADRLAQAAPELFARYLYVGATRAATYLGVTCSTASPPEPLAGARHLFGRDWRSSLH